MIDEENEQMNSNDDAGQMLEGSEDISYDGKQDELLEQQLSDLQKELNEAQSKAKEFSDGWQRERADFINYKKRIDREQSQLTQMITGQVIKKYLVIMDDLERALSHRPENGEGANWAGGIDLIYRKLQSILESEGVQTILADGQTFDPNLHEALSHEDNPDHESGQIIAVVQQGYMIGDRVLRPALVRVAR